MRGVTCNCTSPQRAARAVRTACRVSRAWRRAAPHSPSRGTRRVLTRPGSGARAKTMTTALRLVGVEAGKDLRASAKKIHQPQPPHEQDGARHAARLPAAPRGHDALSKARRRPVALHRLAEGDVLHEGNRRKSTEDVAPHEDRLVAGGDRKSVV